MGMRSSDPSCQNEILFKYMDLPFSKIIVDSRHVDAGTSSSSFEISLPETLSLPHDAVAYVCDLQVTNTFSSTNKNKNTFYWIEQELGQNTLNRVFSRTNRIHQRVLQQSYRPR